MSKANHTEETFTAILERIALGEPAGKICAEPGMPSNETFWAKLNSDDAYSKRYARAKTSAMELMADEIIKIADESTDCESNAGVSAAKLRVDTRRWIMAKLAPKRFGEKLEIDQTTTLQNLSEAEIYERLQQFAAGEPYVQGLLDALVKRTGSSGTAGGAGPETTH